MLLIRHYFLSMWASLHRIACHIFRTFFFLPFLAIRKSVSESVGRKSNTISTQQPTITYTLRVQPQHDLEIVGVGASGQIYKIDDHIVLKTCLLFESPASDASPRDKWFYASDTLYHSNVMKDERAVFQLLEQRPHPNIIEAVDTDHAEGIYLRKYLSLSEIETPNQSGRILWYQDIVRALSHIHKLGIAHSDLRTDNILFDQQGHALLCDFSASSPFGQPNPAYAHPGLPVPLNGLSEVVSAATDQFAMGSLIFKMEHGTKPIHSVDQNGALILPEIHSGHDGIDEVIKNAWLGKYASTEQMLKHLESLYPNGNQVISCPTSLAASRESLKSRIKHWREHRVKQFGCVLNGLPTEDELQELANRYGWEKDRDLCFKDYKVPSLNDQASVIV